MYSLDSFTNVPLIISAVTGVILFVLLIIIKSRNTAKLSFIFYAVLLVLTVGIIYTVSTSHTIYLAITVLAAEILLLPYLIILALGIPRKREKKINQKVTEAEKSAAAAPDTVALEHYEKIHHPYDILKNRCFKLLDEYDELYFKLNKTTPPNWSTK